MPQVSADIHLPLPPSEAAELARTMPAAPARRPPWVHPTGLGWRFRPEGAGTQVVLWATYAVRPTWVRHFVHEVTQWHLARQLRQRVDELADLMRPGGKD